MLFTETARSFLERSGRHIVISGVISPTVTSQSRDSDDVIACESHRVTMCRLAVQQHHWLTYVCCIINMSILVHILFLIYQLLNATSIHF